ncbi:MAG: YraN family protein [Rhodospirillales bacterium]
MTRPPADKKRNAWRYGRFAEALSAWHLRARGYRIVSRGFRSAAGEIDIVARRGRVLVFVEVKARRELSAAAESLGPRQTGRIARAAGAFVQSRPGLAGLDQRFDVMLVRPWRLPVHLEDAWRPQT